jgi:hypothetical protein
MLFIDSILLWIITFGVATTAFYFYKTYQNQLQLSDVQKREAQLVRFETQFFGMVQTFIKKIDGLALDFGKLKNAKANKIDKIYNGAEIFEQLTIFYIPCIEASELVRDKRFAFIKSLYHSTLIQIFNILVFIFEYINLNVEEEKREYYYEYLTVNIPDHLRLLIALYKIHDFSTNDAERLIKEFKVVKKYDFRNHFGITAKHSDFMVEVNE